VAGIEHPHCLECGAVGDVLPRGWHEDWAAEDCRRDPAQRFGPAATADQAHTLNLDAMRLDGIKRVRQAAQQAFNRGTGEMARTRGLEAEAVHLSG
jgi:hypothetical protein